VYSHDEQNINLLVNNKHTHVASKLIFCINNICKKYILDEIYKYMKKK